MKSFLALIVLVSLTFNSFSQGVGSHLDGEWMVADLDNSVVNFYKGADGYWYGKILKSDKALYLNQVIYKGMQPNGKNYWEGIFTTPKSKMNIATKIFLDNNSQMRFVGKKYFITKTYIGKRVK
jgi:hypothetical protein